ncbi:virion-associated phage protein [Burkholderia phage BcepIL02]|uniref:Virion-associated phage protein n=1 Tax=Burkholderia phage BcepIL02 TaxID=2886898 RepID=C5IHP8_9CAUD|nr:virion structural protein [Burkholderia phage BcepIL02]ACR15049.1 virion-associated phage protein [Burkholderia phage BcepIL02]
MNLYALNETPINGWATRQGFAEAAMQLAVTGKSANVLLGAGRADMVLNVTGNGTRRTFGAGAADLVLNVSGNGTRRTFGTADALMELAAAGDGKVTQVVGGTATLMLTWNKGIGGKLIYGEGDAALELDLLGDGRAATGRAGEGAAFMYLLADGWGLSRTPLKGDGLADMWLYPTGVPRLITQNGGAAEMMLRASARERVAAHVYGSGDARMLLEFLRTDPNSYHRVDGAGGALLELEFDVRDQRVVVLPGSFYPAPRARGLRVDHENRALRVPRPQRELAIAEA